MKEGLIFLLICLAVWPALSQAQPPAVAQNVAVGEHTVLAVYPEMAEFVLSPAKSSITIVRFDTGDESPCEFAASISLVEPGIYRADFIYGHSWLVINTVTGMATLCHKNKVEAFFPAGYAGK